MRQNLVKKGVIGRSLGLKCLGPQTDAFFIRIAIFFSRCESEKKLQVFFVEHTGKSLFKE